MSPGYEVWLYGSEARGDADELSDVDILAAGDIPETRLSELQREHGQRLSLSHYTWDEIDHMASDGSLFLLHLALEGRPLEVTNDPDNSLARRLDSLGPYKHSRRDLESFRLAVSDVRASARVDHSPIFELAVLASVFRHSSVLGCYLIGNPTFGRWRPIEAFVHSSLIPRDLVSDLKDLYLIRLYAGRQSSEPLWPTRSTRGLLEWAKIADEYLDVVEEKQNGYSGSVS